MHATVIAPIDSAADPASRPEPEVAPTSAPADDIARIVNAWFGLHARDLPWRRDGFGAWGVLVSEFMLQQTPVTRVIPHLEAWLARWPTPADLAAVPPGEAVRAWATLGYPRRALWLHAAAVEITENHGGAVPQDVDVLLTLTGIGDYTARAVAAFAYGHRHPVVDTNTRRVIARCVAGQAEPAPPSRARDLAAMNALLPADARAAAIFNAGAMELGALICTSARPRCADCPLAALCAWRTAGYPEYRGPKKSVQKKFAGSDRQVRGLILAELRSTRHPVTDAEITTLWPDTAQLSRALSGLVTDGLAVQVAPGLYSLPHE